MGYDVSFHPISPEEMREWYFTPLTWIQQGQEEKVLALAAQHGMEDFYAEKYLNILLENVPGLAPTSLLLLEQLRTIDRKRLRGYIGRISKEKMLEVDAALAISIGIGYPNERRTHNV